MNNITETAAERDAKITVAYTEYIAAKKQLDESLKVLMAAETRLGRAEDREERAHKKCEEMIRLFGKSNWDIALASLPLVRDG